MITGAKIRLYPNKQQELWLKQAFGVARFLWNKNLEMIKERYNHEPSAPFLNAYALNYILPQLKMEYPFLKEVDSTALQLENYFLAQAYINFFKNPKKFHPPKFKSSKHPRQSYTGQATLHVIAKHYVKIPKLGVIKTSKTNFINGKIKRYTISLEPSGKYYLSLQIESAERIQFEKTGRSVGIDLGLINFATLSTGEKIPSFVSDYENQVVEWQRKTSRRRHQAEVISVLDKHKKMFIPREIEDFTNWQRARKTKACYQAKLAYQRKDFLHKLTTRLVKEFDTIVIEDLNVQGMMKNKYLAHSISNASWYTFRRMLEYKTKWYGKELIVVSAKNTSFTCHKCGFVSSKKPYYVQEWTCENCNTHHDKCVNAAQVILDRGLQN